MATRGIKGGNRKVTVIVRQTTKFANARCESKFVRQPEKGEILREKYSEVRCEISFASHEIKILSIYFLYKAPLAKIVSLKKTFTSTTPLE